MGFLRWEDYYSVGVPVFDAHHRRLMDIINELHEGMSAGKGKEATGKVLKALIDYAALHFAEEERRLEASGYIQLPEQRREHSNFLKRVRTFDERHRSGESLLSIDLLDFLRDWLVKHISGLDKQYSQHLISKGMG